MKIVIIACLLIISSAALSACANTLNGAGQDLENAGRSIQETF